MSGLLHVAHEDRMAAIVADMGLRPEPAGFDRTDRVLLQAVAAVSLVTPEAIVGREQSNELTRARQLFVQVARIALGRTIAAVASILERDTATIQDSVRRGRERIASDPDFALVCAVLTRRFRGPEGL